MTNPRLTVAIAAICLLEIAGLVAARTFPGRRRRRRVPPGRAYCCGDTQQKQRLRRLRRRDLQLQFRQRSDEHWNAAVGAGHDQAPAASVVLFRAKSGADEPRLVVPVSGAADGRSNARKDTARSPGATAHRPWAPAQRRRPTASRRPILRPRWPWTSSSGRSCCNDRLSPPAGRRSKRLIGGRRRG